MKSITKSSWLIRNKTKARELGVWEEDGILFMDMTRGSFCGKMGASDAISYLKKKDIVREIKTKVE